MSTHLIPVPAFFPASRQRFVQTDGEVGMSEADADKAIAVLTDSTNSDDE
jgi:hypothetical protein